MNSEVLDTRGDICPVPLLKTIKKVGAMHSGDTLKVVSDHPPARRSIPMELKKRGIEFTVDEKGVEFEITIIVP
ncbi:MAG: sulfurtransferase TusA family protein [Methanosarcinales archaeon]|nr:sulfurtransferase TusA family protein [ANME-2 cluster archaeon]MDF1532300.1 sulfurtransferase TusA family protein [ANME-2 cluster archaeon]MDW7776796.1 sulfurtransferase TusA family protein [Methanosarcinales archaeon]